MLVQYSSDQTSCFKFLDFFGNELLPLQSLFSDLLLDGPSMRADNKVVLDYLPGNAGDVGLLPSKHIDIRPQEGNEHALLFVVKGGADGERTVNAILPCWDLLYSWWSNLGSLASGTLRKVITGATHSG